MKISTYLSFNKPSFTFPKKGEIAKALIIIGAVGVLIGALMTGAGHGLASSSLLEAGIGVFMLCAMSLMVGPVFFLAEDKKRMDRLIQELPLKPLKQC